MADELVTALLAAGRKPKFHELLAQGAASTAPTPSWGAALARALQGGMAGLLERGDENSNVAEFDRLNPQASAQQASAPQSAPLTTLVGNNPAAFSPQVEPQPKGTTMLPVAGTEDTVPLPKRNPLGALSPEFRSKFADLRTAAGDKGAYFDAPEQGSIGNVRSPQQQAVLYAQGRTAPGPVVTGTTQSNHITGKALDVVPTNGSSEKQIGSVLSALVASDPRFAGMRSGATFSNLYDPLHIELNKPQGQTQVASLDPNAGVPQQPPQPPAGPQTAAAPSVAMALQQPPQGQSPPVPQPPPQQMAQALPQQMAQPQARVAPQIPPEVMARAREAARRDGPAAGEAVLAPYRKPADQVVPMNDAQRQQWKVPENMSAGINTVTGHPVFSPPQTNIALNTAQKGQEVMATESAQDFKAAQAAGREAAKRTGVWDTMEQASKGFTPGATADIKLQAKRYLKDLGIIEGNDVPDAEVFKQMQQQLAIHAQPKGQGAVSNFEREMYAKSIANMTMSPEALSRAIQTGRKLDDFDRKVAQVYRDNARKNGGVPDSIAINEEIDKLGAPLSQSEMSYLRKTSDKPTPTENTEPFKPAPNWEFSPSRKQYRDPQGNVYDANGKPVK